MTAALKALHPIPLNHPITRKALVLGTPMPRGLGTPGGAPPKGPKSGNPTLDAAKTAAFRMGHPAHYQRKGMHRSFATFG